MAIYNQSLYEWCNIMHDAILCIVQYYAWCNIMHDAILCIDVLLCMMQYYAWSNIMHEEIICIMQYYACWTAPAFSSAYSVLSNVTCAVPKSKYTSLIMFVKHGAMLA